MMTDFRIDRRALVTGLGATLALPQAGLAQGAWPAGRTLKLVVPFTPGGATDILGRLVADKAGQSWGNNIVVENRPGAGGNIGVEAVARSEPNGDTLLIVSVGLVANPFLYSKVNYDPLTDLAPITMVAMVPIFWSSGRTCRSRTPPS
jgi:tripartite-type tricarboxylate transporter receptor subunit TctC